MTFEEYQQLGGKAELATFSRLEFLVRRKINQRTRNRIPDVPTPLIEIGELTPLKMCVFELIELYSKNGFTADKTIIAESNNGISVSYATPTNDETASETEKIMQAYLWDMKAMDGNSVLWLGVR